MEKFLKIKCLNEKEEQKVIQEIERVISQKKREGMFTEREIREIEEMKLRPLPDIQDIQSVYENILFQKKP